MLTVLVLGGWGLCAELCCIAAEEEIQTCRRKIPSTKAKRSEWKCLQMSKTLKKRMKVIRDSVKCTPNCGRIENSYMYRYPKGPPLQ